MTPRILRGIQTDPQTYRIFETFYRTMRDYREQHAGVRVISMNVTGPPSGMPVDQSLPFLSFFEDNSHSLPVYWSLPVLSTTIYPNYVERMLKELESTHALVVEYRDGGYAPTPPQHYVTLIGAQGDIGYFYLYAPEDRERRNTPEPPIFLTWDAAATKAPAAPATMAAAVPGTSSTAHAAPVDTDQPADFNPNPVGVLRGIENRSGEAVKVFSWPADLPLDRYRGRVAPFAGEPIGRVPIVNRQSSDAFIVEGSADSRFSYLLQYADRPINRGAILRVRGTLYEGGFQVGFLQKTGWCCSVTVTEPGPFEAIIGIQRTGLYEMRFANDVGVDQWQVVRNHWFRGTLNLFTGTYLPNHFVISKMEWLER